MPFKIQHWQSQKAPVGNAFGPEYAGPVLDQAENSQATVVLQSSSPPTASPPHQSSAELPLGASRVGAELRDRRLSLGWALPDVANTLRIRLPYLEAIEDGRLNDMPGNAYAVGFIRTYAAALGLDPVEIARRFRAEAQDVNRQTELAFPAPVPERGVPAGAVLLLGALIAVGTYAAWYKLSGDTRGPAEMIPVVPERLAPLAERAAPVNTSPQIASILPQAGAVPAPGASPAPPLSAVAPPIPVPVPVPVQVPPATVPTTDSSRVMLHLKADSYIQVREKQGKVLLNRVMHAGDTWPMPKGATVQLTTGNAGGTELLIEGVATPIPGPNGAIRRDIPIDVDGIAPGTVLAPAPAPAPRPTPPRPAAPRPAAAAPAYAPTSNGEPPKIPF